MINEYNAKKFCKEDISKIENYDKAVNDTTQIWHCHHMTETWWNCTKKDLIENECYYNRKACELIFLTPAEHRRLHQKGRKLSEETRRKISEAKKGKSSWNKGKTTSVFGKAFYEHYGITRCDNIKLYTKECKFYKHYGHFSWEVKHD